MAKQLVNLKDNENILIPKVLPRINYLDLIYDSGNVKSGVDTLVYTAINDCYSDSTTYNAESRKTKILLNNEFSLNSGIPFLVKNGESITLDKNGGPDIYYSRIKIYGITY